MSQAPLPAPGQFSKYGKMGEVSGSVGAAATGASNAYIVTEKVHGANFCVIASFESDSDPSLLVRFAKRTAIIGSADNADDFYNCRSSGLLRELAPRGADVLRHFAQQTAQGDSPVLAVHIYGELFGGSYPHPAVPAVAGVEPVQVGVWYAPDLRFMAFDVVVEAAQSRVYQHFDVARQACEASGLLFSQPLMRGTLAECLEFEIEFETTLPSRLGLPTLPAGAGGCASNLAEGVVARPRMEPAGNAAQTSSGKESLRGLFKRKIKAFSEKQYQNNDWKKGKAGGGGYANSTFSEEDLTGIEVCASVTEQRLAAVMSKIGRVDPKDKTGCRRLLDDLKEDVCESLEAADLVVLRKSHKLEAELDDLCRQLITRVLVGSSTRK